jgi:enoyl-CoA hydratase
MDYVNILLEQVESGIYRLIVNRPKSLNALNAQTLDEIHAAVLQIGQDPEGRVLLVTGSGEKAFVAGADITEMQNLNPLQARTFSQKGIQAFRALETLPVPTIAVINGFCLGGGCELALSCDWMLASDRAIFGQSEINLGIMPGFGGTQRLSRRVGQALSLELALTGRQVKAEEALSRGLVNQVFPADSLMEEALNLARIIAAKAPIAVRLIKETVQRGQDMNLDNACALENQMFGLCFSTLDQKEGMKAFLEKRKAEFKNR